MQQSYRLCQKHACMVSCSHCILIPSLPYACRSLLASHVAACWQGALQERSACTQRGFEGLSKGTAPHARRSLLLREGQVLEVDSLSELGIYGTFVRRGERVLLNREAGHLVRTKAATSDEGGVAAGFAVLDSPYLVD